jgi:hypothetical protein
MTIYVKNTDIKVLGTLGFVGCLAYVSGIDAEGKPIHDGQAEVDWSSIHPVTKDGEQLWYAEDHKEYLHSEIEMREEETNDA